MPRKKMSLQPQCVRSMRTGVHSRRIGIAAVAGALAEQFRAEAQRVVGGMAHAEHPLVAAHRAHAAADLVGQRLERQPVIGCRQRAGDGVAGAFGLLHGQEMIDRFLEPALEQMLVTFERESGSVKRETWNVPALRAWRAGGTDGSRKGRTGPGPARKGSRCADGRHPACSHCSSNAAGESPAQAPSSDWLRRAGSARGDDG